MNSCNKKYSRTLFLLTISFLIFNCSFLIATIRYVSKTGLSIPPYTSWETAAESIQKCINISVFGDTIYVANGVYEEQVVMIPGLALIGAGADSTIINTQALVNTTGFVAVEVKDSCLFKNFKIIVYYNNDKGYGIAQIGNSIVSQNRITKGALGIYSGWTGTLIPIVYKNIIDNVTHGIYIFNSSPLVRGNIISPTENNASTIMKGVSISANTYNYKPIVDSNYIEAGIRCCGIYKDPGTRSTIKNNEIRLINGFKGIFMHSYVSDSAWVYNNLIYTELPAAYAIENIGIPYLHVNNNYLSGNFLQYALYLFPNNVAKNNVITKSARGIGKYGTPNPIFQYNNVWKNDINYSGFTPDTTNLSVDPMIVNDDSTQGDLDFHLQKYSPLIDAGDPNILDKDGTRSDIGLYGGPYGESYVYVDLPPRPPVNLTAAVDSSIVMLKWNKNTEADFSYYKLFYDTTKNFSADSTKLISSQPDTFYYFVILPDTDSLYFKLTAVDNQGNESNPSEEVGVVVTSVKDEWKPVNNYILYQNYPNPFNPSTKIGYKLRERGYVKLYVYDIKGEMVSVLVNEVQEAGYYEVEFNAGIDGGQSEVGGHSGLSGIGGLASGVYIYQIFINNDNRIPVFSDVKKMLLIK